MTDDHRAFIPFTGLATGEGTTVIEGVTAAQQAFIAELRHWREVSGHSQKALAAAVGYTPSYVSKVETGSTLPSKQFVEQADTRLRAGRALVRRWQAAREEIAPATTGAVTTRPLADDSQVAPTASLIVEHEHAELSYDDGVFRTLVRRQLYNAGTEPVTQYLIRIAVDRHPGDPERSNRLYRESPLTWDEIGLIATCSGEPMSWRVKHDRDAFKELWLLLENDDGKFPLYPGQTVWIEYIYTVSAEKWGPWWQRAIRVPTRRLSIKMDLPTALNPAVWGMETSMTAASSAFRTPIDRIEEGDRTHFVWSIDDPDMHARYRVEWKFRAGVESERDDEMKTSESSDKMSEIGIVQDGDPILTETATRFAFPDEAEDARRVVAQIVSTMERVGQAHDFAKGMGIAAPQIGIGRAAAVVRTANGETLTLLNPRVIDESNGVDEQYEGCLSFFDVRGMVPRPRSIEVEHQDVDGRTHITVFQDGVARLVAHEIDHLDGLLYRSRMRPGVEPISVAQYRGTGRAWSYR
ncbi:peptide deformylase [Pseudonocardia sp. EV170527-09]|uniref:peptide deformylase n=1 Tax=Pseudonocardia sp. EV170527-09 TaxID=2603411 RepID=UPI001F009EAE|nr:peptide deformylase [Pseudonocardia sp. EV170527-09]